MKRILPAFMIIKLTVAAGIFQHQAKAGEIVSEAALPRTSVSLYTGPGSPSPLIDIARLKNTQITREMIVTAALNRILWSNETFIAVETEVSVAKHLERADMFSFGWAVSARWLKTPWHNVFGGSFAFGNGFSYATVVPHLESKYIARTNRVLYHMLMEVAFGIPGTAKAWEAFFRIHHRSGAFGMFNEVVGGSDFLCLGGRYRF